jgi:predicted metal-binding membrane protein
MFQRMIGDYTTFYSLLFSYNMFKHVPFKGCCIPMTLLTPHWKFIVSKQNFK